jgi:cytochrome b561
MHWIMSLYVAALFFVLTPGVLVSLPPGGKKLTVALTHAVVFAIVYHFTHKLVWRTFYEGFETAEPEKKAAKKRSAMHA